MPKTRSFELSPLAPEVLASVESLGQKIAATRKARGITQREMATSIGISPQTMLFIEQGRPNVQIGHYARALSALDGQLLSLQTPAPTTIYKQASSSASTRANAMQRYLATARQQPTPYTGKLQFAYDWPNPNMADETLIRKVVDKGRFHDLAVVCKRYGLDRVRKIAGDKIALSPSLRRSFNNIEKGFARTNRTLLGEQIRSRDLYDLFVLAKDHGYATSQLLHDAVTYGTNNDPEYHKAVLRGDIPLDADDEGLESVGVKAALEEIYHYFDAEISHLEIAEAARIAQGLNE